METPRTLILLKLQMTGIMRRIRYDLMREIVVAICGLIVFALFSYVFGDFIEGHLARISPTSMRGISHALAVIFVAGLPLVVTRRRLINRTMKRDLASLSERLGETPRVRTWFRRYEIFFSSIIVSLVAATGIRAFLPSISNAFLGFCIVIATTLGLALPVWMRGLLSTNSHVHRPSRFWTPPPGISRERVMISWRVFQMLFRNRTVQSSIALAIACQFLGLLSGAIFAIDLVVFGFGILSGFLPALALSFQLQEDLRNTWAERMMGVSHDEVIGAYQKICWAFCVQTLVVYVGVGYLFTAIPLLTLTQFAMASCCFMLIMPGLLFQIDPRRPLIQACIDLMFGVFIATGIYIHIATVVLIPLLNYYTVQYQKGRYFRA